MAFAAVETCTLTLYSDGCSTPNTFTFLKGSSTTITAEAKYGYRFKRWSDGYTNNPRNITVNSDVSYTAIYECITDTITVASQDCNEVNTFIFLRGTQTTLTPVARYGYTFVKWTDGYKDNPRKITVNGNATYTAVFTSNMDTITLASQGCEEVNTFVLLRGTRTTLTPTPRYGYKFVKWTDGYKDNPRTITTNGNAIYTAVFEEVAPDLRTILLYADGCETPDTFNCAYNMLRSFEAIPEEHYHFVRWNDNNQDNPRTINVTDNASYTAFFAIDQHTISVTAENGTVEGAGVYEYGSEATITITPGEGYRFTQWGDGNTDNPRTLVVTQDSALVAYFEEGTPEAKQLPYVEPFSANQGEFSIHDVSLDGLSYVWQFTTNYGMKASAYVGGVNHATDSWLISPRLEFPADATITMTFDHVHRYTTTPQTDLTLLISEDYVKGAPSTATWTQVTIPTYAPGSNWTFVNAGTIDLSSFGDKIVTLAFRYQSSSSVAATWEIKNVSVTASSPSTGLDDVLNQTITTKCIIDGHLFILRDGHKYTATGTMIE